MPRAFPFLFALPLLIACGEVREEVTITRPSGSILAKGWRVNGQKNGTWSIFSEDGAVMRSGTYDHDRKEGTWTGYGPSGAVLSESR
ncbi:MAG: hypothetical protein KDB88_08170, partial [Flavobacteriales bacterium]|nr:hypothetical protein [Flavobacteriales bacterium]